MATTQAPSTDNPRFLTGSTMRHVLVMSSAGAVGLLAIFVVDLANLLYISLLGDPSLTAAVGFATTIIFFFISMNVGLSIGGTALVARALGARDTPKARRLAGSALALSLLVSGGFSLAILPFADELLDLLGAEGETRDVARTYLLIVLPATPLMGIFMIGGGFMRAVGDARRSMYGTLLFGLTTALLDPIFIFVLGWEVTGAAVVAVIARVAAAAYALYVATRVHDVIRIPSPREFIRDVGALTAIAGPAILTNIATPAGNAYVTSVISEFDDPAVAGWSIISRLIPVSFAAMFALSGAIGPIIGQNYGAKQFDRIRSVITDSVLLSLGYLAAVGLAMYLGRDLIAAGFGVDGEAAALVIFFCSGMSVVYGFTAGMFIANAAFNNLGYPLASTAFNWARATIGTVPFVLVGADWAGARGVIAGFSVGSIPFGIAGVASCLLLIGYLSRRDGAAEPSDS